MEILKSGSRGPLVALLQLALGRGGYYSGEPDGIFGAATDSALRRFQSAMGLVPDGLAGELTQAALEPWYTGRAIHTVRPGDTLYRIALSYGSTVRAVELANPGLDVLNLRPGSSVVVPFSFPVVPVNIPWSSALTGYCVVGLTARYPALKSETIGRSVLGSPIWALTLGDGEDRVLYNASHHANEWITTPLLFRFVEDLARAAAFGGSIYGLNAAALLRECVCCAVPAVNPDGIDLVTGALTRGSAYDGAVEIAGRYPDIPFPSGWKANISGIDLNLQYPAGWEQARDIKFSQGFTSPAPRDYVGSAPLEAAESRALYDFTLSYSPSLTLSYHTQGEVIYWKFLDYEPPRSAEIARLFGDVSGYLVEETPYASGFAGYKDWFIQNYNRPGYTIEAGLGANPLPLSQFGKIYSDNIGILTLGMTAASGKERDT